MGLSDKLTKLSKTVYTQAPDLKKFEMGNNTAGIRVRAGLQDVRALAKEIRFEIQKIRKQRKAVMRAARDAEKD